MSENISDFSFKHLLKELLQIRLYIIYSSVLILVVTAIFLYQHKQNWKGTIEINSINSTEAHKYLELLSHSNEFRTVFGLTNNPNFLIQEKITTSEFSNNLRDLLIEEIEDFDEFKLAFSELKILNNTSLEKDESFENKLKQEQDKFKINKPILSKDDSRLLNKPIQTSYTIDYIHTDRVVIEKLFKYILNKANLNTKTNIEERFDLLISNLLQLNAFKIDDIQRDIDAFSQVSELQDEARVSFLIEQSAIARTLDIKNPIITRSIELTHSFDNEASEFIQDEEPYYYRGYAAIEKEIELINKRDVSKPNFNEVYEMYYNKATLEKDMLPYRIEAALEVSPIKSENFKSVSYNTNRIVYSKIGMTKLTLISYFLLIIFGTIIVYFYQIRNVSSNSIIFLRIV